MKYYLSIDAGTSVIRAVAGSVRGGTSISTISVPVESSSGIICSRVAEEESAIQVVSLVDNDSGVLGTVAVLG